MVLIHEDITARTRLESELRKRVEQLRDNDLLDVSRAMRGKIELRKEPVELATVVARAVETAEPLIDVQQHDLDISLQPESPTTASALRRTCCPTSSTCSCRSITRHRAPMAGWALV